VLCSDWSTMVRLFCQSGNPGRLDLHLQCHNLIELFTIRPFLLLILHRLGYEKATPSKYTQSRPDLTIFQRNQQACGLNRYQPSTTRSTLRPLSEKGHGARARLRSYPWMKISKTQNRNSRCRTRCSKQFSTRGSMKRKVCDAF
jgi:hypothetical protein